MPRQMTEGEAVAVQLLGGFITNLAMVDRCTLAELRVAVSWLAHTPEAWRGFEALLRHGSKIAQRLVVEDALEQARTGKPPSED